MRAQVLLGRPHGRVFFDRPGLVPARVRYEDPLPVDARAGDLALINAVEDVADWRAWLAPDRVAAAMAKEPESGDQGTGHQHERRDRDPFLTQAGRDRETAKRHFHRFLNPSG